MSSRASPNQTQLIQLLVRTVLPGAQGSALVERAADALSIPPPPGAPPTVDGVALQIEALLAHLPDRAGRFQALRRRLASAGAPGSGMAAFRDSASLLELLLALQGVPGAPTVAPQFTDAASGALALPAAVPPRPLPPASVDALAASGAFLPPWVERALVRDLAFALQGVDGVHVHLDADADAFVVSDVVDGFAVPHAIRTCVAFLGELGWAHRRVLRLLQEENGREGSPGLVRRAFTAALRAELGDFYRVLAELDAAVAEGAEPRLEADSDALPAWSLRRLLVWAAEPLLRMRCVAELVDACAGLHGAAIASQLHLHHGRGDPSTRGLVGRVLAAACKPLVAMAFQWLSQGHVATDAPPGEQAQAQPPPPPEFFVRADATYTAVEDLWERRFSLEPAAVPLFLSRATAAALFEAGKSVHFMLVACNDGEWVAAHVQPAVDDVARMMAGAAAAAAAAAPGSRAPPRAPATVPASLALTQAVLASLEGPDLTGARLIESTLAVVRPLVDARLRHLLLVEHRLEAHLQGIQRYILLGQGDFVSAFLTAVEPELGRPATAIALSVPALDGALESAIRASNAQHDDRDTLARVGVRLLTPSPGDSGWDVFTLSYAMTPPLSAVVTPDTADTYARLFYFLWRVRRVEHALTGVWTLHAGAAQSIRALGHAGLARVLHASHLLRAELTGFVQTLVSYLMFEVIAAAWQGLQGSLAAAGSMADVLAAHRSYLGRLVDRALLSPRAAPVAAPLEALLALALEFAALQEELVAAALAQVEVRRAHEVAASRRAAAGEWGAADDEESDLILGRIALALDRAAGHYGPRADRLVASARDGTKRLLAAMDAASLDGSDELRNLVLRFDFNGFYER